MSDIPPTLARAIDDVVTAADQLRPLMGGAPPSIETPIGEVLRRHYPTVDGQLPPAFFAWSLFRAVCRLDRARRGEGLPTDPTKPAGAAARGPPAS